MVNLGTYKFKIKNIDKITPKQSFTYAYVEEVFKLENIRTSTKQ